MAIDNLVKQLLERIRQDPELRRQLAQLIFGPELVQFADQMNQLTMLLGRLAETVQDGFRIIGERFALVDAQLTELRRIVAELAGHQRETSAQIQALTQRVAELTDRMERVERQQAETTEQIRLLTDRMERVERQQAETTEQIRLLTDRMERVEQQIAELAAAVRRHTDDLGQLRGWYLEVRMRDRAPAIFGIWMDETRVVPPMEVRKLVRDALTRGQLQRLLDADIIAIGVLDDHPARPTVWLVIEVSTTVDQNDVERALARAELLRRVVPHVIPVVAGDQLTDPARVLTEGERVVVVHDGTIVGWEEAIERWVRAA
ncbi:MAG: hypothetical protein RMK01_08920 [Thermomicrobium sp.]|nr:hypothetical protein [Thermomicrobium sp.]